MECGSSYLKTLPHHVDQVETQFMRGEVEVIKMPVIHNPVLFFL